LSRICVRHVQVSDEVGGGSTTSSDDTLAPAAAAADPELGVPPANGVHHSAQDSVQHGVQHGLLHGVQNGGGAIDGGKGPDVESIELDAESDGQSEGQKGMVLPFQPMTVTFRDVHYYVPTEVSTAVQSKF